jgi:molybdopterin-guanine dinucleotide biosynthesis protein A
MSRQPFTACLLAGGKSSRMGRDKAGVEFSGEPLWRRQLRTLGETAADEILISGRKSACYADCSVTIVEDGAENAGPLAGIAALLSAAAHPLVLILAIDMPHMTGAYLRGLRELCTGQHGIVPEHADFFEGLAAFFPKSAAAIALRNLSADDHSIQHFVRECVANDLVKTLSVSADEIALFQSVNAPADLLNQP